LRRLLLIAIFLYSLLMLDMTLRWFPEEHPSPNLIPFRSIAHDLHVGGQSLVVNLVGNLLAFMPLGVMLTLLSPRRSPVWSVIATGAAFSGAIEVAQFLSGRRTADIDDLLLNTTGTLLGFLALAAVRAWTPGRLEGRTNR
jgi:glycopeptide antibiotics resistance protein